MLTSAADAPRLLGPASVLGSPLKLVPQPEASRPMIDPVVVERFWRNVDKREPDECWPWDGSRCPVGYGMMQANGTKYRATRVSLVLSGKPRPSEKHFALHKCDNPPCVNPAHLWWGTNADNTNDAIAKGRHNHIKKTHCPSGHPYSGDNLITRSGMRECRICKNKSSREFERRLRAKQATPQGGGGA